MFVAVQFQDLLFYDSHSCTCAMLWKRPNFTCNEADVLFLVAWDYLPWYKTGEHTPGQWRSCCFDRLWSEQGILGSKLGKCLLLRSMPVCVFLNMTGAYKQDKNRTQAPVFVFWIINCRHVVFPLAGRESVLVLWNHRVHGSRGCQRWQSWPW